MQRWDKPAAWAVSAIAMGLPFSHWLMRQMRKPLPVGYMETSSMDEINQQVASCLPTQFQGQYCA